MGILEDLRNGKTPKLNISPPSRRVPVPLKRIENGATRLARSVKDREDPDSIRRFREAGFRAGGLSNHPLYAVWCGMRLRCNSKYANHPTGAYCAGRGIKVCRSWDESFLPFYRWALRAGWKPGLTLDRRNNRKGYSPGNCRFVTQLANAQNRRDAIHLTAFGETKHLMEWVRDERCRVSQNTLRSRVTGGWDHEQAIVTPAQRGKRTRPV